MNRKVWFLLVFSLLISGVFAPQGQSQTLLTNTWSSAGHMTEARTGAAAVQLTDGRILITGGSDSNGVPQATAEVYDPATGVFTAAPEMNVPRANHAAILLGSGDVLVTGGLTTGGGYSDSAEIYSVSSQQWTLVPSSIGTGLAGHAMALLSDGNVLIAGGTSTTKVVSSIVLFNVTTETFTPIGTLLTPRTGAAAAATPDGRVLIVGGTDINGAVLASTEIFVYSAETMTGTVSYGPTMASARVGATATSTYDGVAVIGGNNGQNDLGTAEIFSQWTNTFTVVSGGTPRSYHFAVLLPKNGSILVMGGTGGTKVDLLEPWANSKAGAFIAASDSLVNQDGGFGSPASLGSLLAAGGMGSFASAAELYWFPTISTDKPDYAPGTPVQMSGTGFQPSEMVDLHLHLWVDQSTEDVPDATATADSLGNFSYDGYAPNTSDIGARYHLTAVGKSSGYQAQTIFTDGITTISFGNGSLNQPTAPASGAATAAECGELILNVGESGGSYGTIYLSDSTTSGSFYSSQSSCESGANKITQFTPGSSTTDIWYRDSAAGSPQLTACTITGGVDICELEAALGLGAIFSSQTESIYGTATQISFLTQPIGGAPGVVWLQQPVVAVQDANYNTVASNSDAITLTISTNPGGGTLTCADTGTNGDTLSASSGVAAFSGCKINNASTACYVLKATDTTLGFTATSNCFYISNPADTNKSTVIATPTTVVDNGGGTGGVSTIAVTLKDINGNAVSGKTVTLTANVGSSTISGGGSGVSNSSGVVDFTVTDTVPEVVIYTAVDATDGVTITQTATVTFAPGQVSASNSTVTRTPATVSADGVSISTITVTLEDSSGDAIAGETVTLSQGSGHSVITPASATTNSNGVATFTVTDTTVESVTYTAGYSGTYGTGSLTTHTVSVNFTGIGTTLTLTVNPNNTTYGTSPIVLTSGLSVTSSGAALGGVAVSFYESTG
ncbi:MAG: kelch repeat-containing protein, partial [Terracidiphilus sp.]